MIGVYQQSAHTCIYEWEKCYIEIFIQIEYATLKLIQHYTNLPHWSGYRCYILHHSTRGKDWKYTCAITRKMWTSNSYILPKTTKIQHMNSSFWNCDSRNKKNRRNKSWLQNTCFTRFIYWTYLCQMHCVCLRYFKCCGLTILYTYVVSSFLCLPSSRTKARCAVTHIVWMVFVRGCCFSEKISTVSSSSLFQWSPVNWTTCLFSLLKSLRSTGHICLLFISISLALIPFRQ